MAAKRKVCITLLLLLYVLALSAGLALAMKDPELKQCKHQCKVQQQADERQKEQCRKECDKYYKEKKQIEREQRGGSEAEEEEEEEEEERGGGSLDELNTRGPEQRFKQCQRQCDRQEGEQQEALCRLRCREKYRSEKGGGISIDNKHKKESEEEEQEEEDPYVFEPQHFSSRVGTGHGGVFLLPKFTQRSKLLRALENYRLGILVANPQTFVVPHHFDADAVFLVTWGRGTITMIRENKRESVNVERGDIIKVPAGTHLYLINRDDNEKLYIVKLIRPINLPGQYEAFFGAGGFNPNSFFRAFSYEILEAAFKSTRDKVDKLFSQHGQGVIVKANKVQIQALSQGGGGPSIWPFAGQSGSSFNVFRKPTTQSNNYGQLFEVDSNDFSPLQDLDIRVSYANITKGAMSAPFYNSRSTKVAIVVAGEGHVEIACPHISGSRERREQKESKSKREKGGTTFHQVRSRIQTDTVVVIPAGHPFVTVASKDSNLEIACFEINAQGNIRYTLAGRGNIFNFMEREAKELAFRTRSEEVDQMFGKQEEELFFPGPTGPHEEGRASE